MSKTDSEALFEGFCRASGLPLVPIPTEARAGRRTPDYELLLGNPPIAVEVKQIDPNAEEIAAERAHGQSGKWLAFRGTPGARLRRRISEAAHQLRARCKLSQPALVVVYNNVWFRRSFTSDHNVLAAMYGELVIHLAIPERGPTVSEPGLGGNRGVGPNQNRVVSALGVLDHTPTDFELRVYHNDFARAPIDPTLLQGPRVSHFRRHVGDPGELPGWRAV